jgi:nitronate monooxygenase
MISAGAGAVSRSSLHTGVMAILERLELPIVQAPLAGGPSTPALAAAVSEAGGLGFLAAGYKTPEAVRADLEALGALTARPFGLNVFAPPAGAVDADAVRAFAGTLRDESERAGVPLGEPRRDDDGWEAKLALAEAERVPVVSFTFGSPDAAVIERLHAAGVEAWVTVTGPAEARIARDAGADALVVQGVEAGGHRASFDDDAGADLGILAALQLIGAAVELPLVATGGLATGRAVAAVLAAGAAAAQLGTAFMRCPEAGTAAAHREALAGETPTALTRAFTGRTARGIVNRFQREHSAAAPLGYPDVHHVTAPLRRAARERGDADGFHLWAGQAHALAEPVAAGELVRRLAADARAALEDAARR